MRHRKPGTSWTDMAIEGIAVCLAIPVVLTIVGWAWVLARLPEGWITPPNWMRASDE